MSLLDDKLTLLANKIRAKAGVTGKLTLGQMQSSINSFGSTATSTIDGLVKGTLTSVASNAGAVGDYVFYDFRPLVSVDFPNATYIGNYAFWGCQAMTAVNIPSATSIGRYTFYNCRLLETIDIPSVISVDEYGFYSCGLQTINLPLATYVGAFAFYNCKLTSINMPNVTDISDEAFRLCQYLTSIYFPNITYINANAFRNCSRLVSIDLPQVTKLSNYVFQDCTKLVDINLPNLKNVGACTFTGCNALTSVDSVIFPSVLSVGDEGFSYCEGLLSVDLPNATSVGDKAFQYCTKLTSVKLPQITTIEGYVFSGCSKLTTVDIPNATFISSNSFQACNALESLTFSNLETISGNAFYSTMLRSLSLTSPTQFVSLNNTNAFTYTPIANGEGYIYVHGDLIDRYKRSTNWNVFANQFKVYGKYVKQLSDEYLLYNNTKTISIPFYGYETPTITVTSSNTNIASISNITIVDELLTFDLTSYGTEGQSTITVKITSGTDSVTREFLTKVYAVIPLTATVLPVDGASYGFVLNEDGYYESTNQGRFTSASVCQVVIENPFGVNVYFDCINSGASGDYGVISNVGETLNLSSTTESASRIFHSFKDLSSLDVQTVDMGVIEGTVWVKYRRHTGNPSGNDSLQFKIRME